MPTSTISDSIATNIASKVSANNNIDNKNEEDDAINHNKLGENMNELVEEGSMQQHVNTEEEESVGQFDDLFDDDIIESNGPPLGEECGSLDDDDDELGESRLVRHEIDLDNQEHPLHELTVKQWVVGRRSDSMMKCDTVQKLSDQHSEYTKATLPIALKLTDFLVEAEKEEQNGYQNPVPLESIVAKNILIRSRDRDASRGEVYQYGVVEYVSIMSPKRQKSDTGTVMARLCAVGNVLYELFAGDDEHTSLFEDSIPAHDAVECIEEEENDDHQRKRHHSTHSQGRSSGCITKLASKGYPSSIQALVSNLLNCGKDEYCHGDDTYTSFNDLRQDLSLMMNDPSRFLEDIPVSNGLPKLEICDKLYGRESEKVKLDQLYQQNIEAKQFNGVIISGGAGVGKSRLAMHIQKLTNEANGYFCAAKFQQKNMHLKPLSIIGTLFNSLCDRFAEDASPLQLESVSVELTNALGSQAGLLAGVVPSLSKLMPSNIQHEEGTSSTCVDAPLSMRYLFGELLYIISSHSCRPISLFVDDIQFADHSSLLLIRNLLFRDANYNSSVFFLFCHRDNDADYDSATFDIWLSSISMYSLEKLKLNNMNIEGVNSLVSDALHLSPRITRQLSEVLHHKTMGNPLFVRQLLVSLTAQGYIYVDMSQPRWTWDLNKIADQEISESVLDLLVNDMKRLPSDLQLGLKVASCLGSRVQKNVLNILSKDLGIDLLDILKQVSQKGFMSFEDDGATFTFAHDKIQQAAYELMPEQQRRKNHMQYGMAICSHTLNNCPDNNELFFTAITQINHGGPSVISDPSKTILIAKLNLRAGKLSIELSDYASALSLFEHGISYLGDDKWTSEYELTLNLFDAAAEAACVLNKNAEVMLYTEQLTANAKSLEDSLNGKVVSARSLHQAKLLQASMSSLFDTLSKLGEEHPREISDTTLHTDMQTMNEILRNTPDESILNMRKNDAKKIATTVKLLENLNSVLHLVKPSLIGAVSLRMVELTMTNGLVPSSPIAFGYYGEVQVALGNISEGCRFGRLALKLVENTVSIVNKSAVIAGVYSFVLWAVEPLQSIAEAHRLGRRIGEQTGDYLHTALNWHFSILLSYLAGGSLTEVIANIQDYITTQGQSGEIFIRGAILLYHQARVLKEGLCELNVKPPNNILTEAEAHQRFSSVPLFLSQNKVHQLVRAYLFRRLNDVSLDIVNISDDIERNKHQLRLIFVLGLFFEGLASFLLARQTTRDSEQRASWIEKGENVLTKMKYWSEHSSWNWESKMVLLEAEKMYTIGSFDQALLFYERAIRSAHEHKFVNDEAIASELAGIFFCERGLNDVKTEALLLHSVHCYKTWGALAVAKRVETFIASKFGSDCMHCVQQWPLSVILASVFASNKKKDSSSKKRQEMK